MASGPMPVGIEGLNATPFMDFRGGRVTMDNLSEMRKEELLLANNILILADRMPVQRPGYTLVQALANQPGWNYQGPVLAIYDYQRDIDSKQFIIVQLGPSPASANGYLLALDPANNYAPFNVLNANSGPFGGGKAAFAPITPYELLVGSPDGCVVLLDVGDGKLTAVPAGITAPPAAPTVIPNPGSPPFEPTYGWTYAFCWVRKWTDVNGNTFYHIGPPSPATFATTGGGSNGFEVYSTTGPPNAYWNFAWVFRTNDTPQGTTSALFFLAEVPSTGGVLGPMQYFDQLPDTDLDLTRPIPYDNYPPPSASAIQEYHSRVLFVQIPGSPDLVQVGGDEEILLGVPQETAPPDLFFDVPAGRKSLSAVAVFNQQSFISSLDFWFTFTGYDISTFQLRDKACEPGAVGPTAWCTTHTHLVYLAEDRNIWAWDGVSTRPVMFSKDLSKQLLGCLSMEDINPAALAGAEMRWFHTGRYNMIMVMVNTGAVPVGQFDWIQCWDCSFLGETFDDDVTPVGLVETDFFPSDAITTTALFKAGFQTYLAMGDPNGNVYRWPDGDQDNGKNFGAAMCTPWSPLNVFIGPMFHPIAPANVVKRMFFADIHTDRQDAVSSFQIAAVVCDSPDMTLSASSLPLGPLPGLGRRGPAPTAARAKFYDVPKTSVGRWVRTFVIWPDDGGGGTLIRLDVSAKPLYGLAP